MLSHVRVIEVGLRDGLQSEPRQVATGDKVRLLNRLIAAGVPQFEVSSFVSPRAVPQIGSEGWGWKDVLPIFFKRSESNTRGASEYHGGDGPLRVSDPVMRSPAIEVFIRAADSVGIPHIPDLNAPPYEGVDFQQHTIRDGRRETSFNAFIEPYQGRKNLTVLGKAQVLRLVMEGNTATGIEVLQDDQRRIIQAAREIVVSAGSLNSPHLLMLSGIGDAEKLRAKGVEARVNLPGVGQNLGRAIRVRSPDP